MISEKYLELLFTYVRCFIFAARELSILKSISYDEI